MPQGLVVGLSGQLSGKQGGSYGLPCFAVIQRGRMVDARQGFTFGLQRWP
jgi:hypothetical protein